LDTLNPAAAIGSEMIRLVDCKHYTDEFRRQAVDLYESTEGATFKGIADDLGIARGTLAQWGSLSWALGQDRFDGSCDDAERHVRTVRTTRRPLGRATPGIRRR